MDAGLEVAVADVLTRAALAPTVWVACSGGMDSTVLLQLAARLARERVAALHVDHGLHPQSPTWRAHCQRQASDLGVRFVTRRVDVEAGPNLEARARAARYDVFEGLLEAGDALLLAHHADDQLETMLLRLLRGTDTPRLGMPSERSIGSGRLFRPFLSFTRAHIEAAAEALGLHWVEDPSNGALHADRNFLRHQIIPIVRQRWPDAATRAAGGAIRSQTVAEIATAALDAELGDDPTRLSAQRLTGTWGPRLVRRWLQRNDVDGVREGAIAELIAQLQRGARVGVEVMPGVFVRQYDAALHLVDACVGDCSAQAWDLRRAVQLQCGVLRARQHGQPLPVQRVTIEPRRGGERVRLAGHNTPRKVTRLLQEHRIAPWQRRSYPLVFVGGVLAVVPGVVVDAGFIDSFATTSPVGRSYQTDDVWIIEYETKLSARRAFRL